MKYLCVCDGGNVRSHALAFVLKHVHREEAIAIGRLSASPETMAMMCAWADWIVVMQPHMTESLPPGVAHKTLCVDVGEDRFGIYVHPELLQLVNGGADWLRGRVTLEGKSANKALAEPPPDESRESTKPTQGPTRAAISERRRQPRLRR